METLKIYMVERLPGPQKRMLHSKRKGVERLDFFWEDSHAGYIYIYIGAKGLWMETMNGP